MRSTAKTSRLTRAVGPTLAALALALAGGILGAHAGADPEDPNVPPGGACGAPVTVTVTQQAQTVTYTPPPPPRYKPTQLPSYPGMTG